MDFNKIGTRMRQRRLELGLSLAEVGTRLNTSASAVQRWENGSVQSIKTTRLKDIAWALQTSVEYLLDVQPEYKPLDGLLPQPDPVLGDFSILISDESMINARILPGDEVFIKKTQKFEDGDLLAVRYNDTIIIRRVYSRAEGGFALIPENPMFATIRIDRLDLIGRATKVLGDLK